MFQWNEEHVRRGDVHEFRDISLTHFADWLYWSFSVGSQFCACGYLLHGLIMCFTHDVSLFQAVKVSLLFTGLPVSGGHGTS